jgi:site-specific DNA recombinase
VRTEFINRRFYSGGKFHMNQNIQNSIAVYGRESTTKGAERNESLDIQAHIYQDVRASGILRSRPQPTVFGNQAQNYAAAFLDQHLTTNPTKEETCLVYCRVSAAKSAQQGESLDTQERICRELARQRGFKIVPEGRVFRETFTGRKDERPALDEAFDYIRRHPGQVKYFVFRVIDRFTRAGSYSYQHIKRKLAKYGIEMIDTYGIIQPTQNTLKHTGFEYEWSKYSPSEIAEIVVASTAQMEVTNILTRLIGRQIEITQQGYKVRSPADGFINQKIYVENKRRIIQVPHPTRARYYIEMFNLRAAGILNDVEIVRRINAMGFRTKVHNRWDRTKEKIIGKKGGIPLTIKRFQEMIQRPIYCGVVCEKWTWDQPIQAPYPGLITIELFNKANRGKVYIEQNGPELRILHDYNPERQKKRRARFNALFPYKSLVLCSYCGKPFVGSCPRGRLGGRFPTYSCSRNHKYFGVPKAIFEQAFESFLRQFRLSSERVPLIERTLIAKYEEQTAALATASLATKENIERLRNEQKAKTEAFVAASSSIVRARLEREIEDLEGIIQRTGEVRGKMGVSADEIQQFLGYAKLCLELLPEFLEDIENPRHKVEVYKLVFEEMPTYQDLLNGTPKFTWIFDVVSESVPVESVLARLAGLSWNSLESTIDQWAKAFQSILTKT